MSSDGTVQALETADYGFTITKEISQKGGEHIQVDLEITSTHDKQATVDLVETVPAGTDQSQIGFLPDNEPTEWDVTADGRLRLQSRLVAQGTRQIVYGIRDIETDELQSLAETTSIADVGGPAGDDVDLDADGDSPGEADAPASGTAASDDSPPSDSSAAAAPSASDGETLDGQLDDQTAAELAEQLAPHIEDQIELDALTETKLAQLQEDVSDIRGYLPAFEEFLGETGRADDILDELEALRARVDEMDETPEGLEETIEDVDERLATVEETVEGFDETLDAILARLEDLEGWREDIAAASQ